MKKLLSLLSVLFLISWCYESFREYVIFEPNHIKDGKYYYENEIYTGKVEGRIEGKIKNGMLDGYVYENHIHRKGGIDGLYTKWYKNGQKKEEKIYKFGKEVSSEEWNEDGSVDE